MNILENGSVTSPRGFTAAAVAAEIKYIGRSDLTIVYSKVPAQAAAVYTLNKFKAAPLQVTEQNIANGTAQAIVVNSGIANAGMGTKGMEQARQMSDWTAEALGIAKDDVDVPEHWVRWELVCKDDRAQVVCEQLLNTGFAIGDILSGVLSNYFSILDENPLDSHKSRWSINERWQRFLGDVQPIRLFRVLKSERTLQDVVDWIKSQCAPSLSAIMQVYGVDWLEREIGLNAWRMNKNLSAMTIAEAQRIELQRQKNKASFV